MNLWLWAAIGISGSVGGFLDALAGMGFGAISSTIMVSVGITPAIVIATINMAKVGSGLVAAISHWRMGNIKWQWVLPLMLPALAGGVLAALAITVVPENTIRVVMPSLLLVMGLLILRRFLFRTKYLAPVAGGSGALQINVPRTPLHLAFQRLMDAPRYLLLGSIGFMGGLINGLSGAFGPFVTSFVLLRYKGHPRYTIGTVSFVEFFVAGAISITLLIKLPWGEIHWGLPLALMIGSIVTAPLGAHLSRCLPTALMGILVGATLIAVNLWSLFRFLQ